MSKHPDFTSQLAELKRQLREATANGEDGKIRTLQNRIADLQGLSSRTARARGTQGGIPPAEQFSQSIIQGPNVPRAPGELNVVPRGSNSPSDSLSPGGVPDEFQRFIDQMGEVGPRTGEEEQQLRELFEGSVPVDRAHLEGPDNEIFTGDIPSPNASAIATGVAGAGALGGIGLLLSQLLKGAGSAGLQFAGAGVGPLAQVGGITTKGGNRPPTFGETVGLDVFNPQGIGGRGGDPSAALNLRSAGGGLGRARRNRANTARRSAGFSTFSRRRTASPPPRVGLSSRRANSIARRRKKKSTSSGRASETRRI